MALPKFRPYIKSLSIIGFSAGQGDPVRSGAGFLTRHKPVTCKFTSAHRECLDLMLITGEPRLRLVLGEHIDASPAVRSTWGGQTFAAPRCSASPAASASAGDAGKRLHGPANGPDFGP
jgi:hypothetical protein